MKIKNMVEIGTVIDVRTPEEYVQGHYEGAINIPLDQVSGSIEDFKTMRSPIVMYCRSGGRSGLAVSILREHGISEVYNGGGLSDLLQ